MLEFLNPEDAMSILKKDHTTVKGLFDQFEKATALRQKKKIVSDAIKELKIHATIEEEIFYPALRNKPEVKKDLLNEADEEHHVAKLLIAELEQMDGTEDHFDAKFTVLSENIRHHIKEEEGDLFPQARKTNVDFTAVGKQLLVRKKQLLKSGVPACTEEKMIAQFKAKVDSPADASRKPKPKAPVKAAAKAKAPAKAASKSKAKAPKGVVRSIVARNAKAKAAPKKPARAGAR